MSTGWVNGLAAEKAKGFGGYGTEYGLEGALIMHGTA